LKRFLNLCRSPFPAYPSGADFFREIKCNFSRERFPTSVNFCDVLFRIPVNAGTFFRRTCFPLISSIEIVRPFFSPILNSSPHRKVLGGKPPLLGARGGGREWRGVGRGGGGGRLLGALRRGAGFSGCGGGRGGGGSPRRVRVESVEGARA